MFFEHSRLSLSWVQPARSADIKGSCSTGSHPVPRVYLYFRVQSSSFNERQERGNVVQEFPTVFKGRPDPGPQEIDFFLRIQWTCSSRNDLWVELVVLTKTTFRQLKAFMQLFCSGLFLKNYFFLALFLCCPQFDCLLIVNNQGEAQPNNSLNLRRNSLTILGLCLSDTK